MENIRVEKGILSRLQKAGSETQKHWIITDALLQALPPDLAEAALAAAVPHWFDGHVLSALLRIELKESEHLYQDLQPLSFCEPFGELGCALHDLTRASVLNHLTGTQSDLFQIYSKRAYEHFCQFDDPQNTVEAIYNLLATDKTSGMEKFKEQMKNYRWENNFIAVNNLERNAQELVELELLKKGLFLR